MGETGEVTGVPWRYLLRGVVGFGALAAAVVLIPVLGPGALFPAVGGLFALRGCPMCWAAGLVRMVSRGRMRGSCPDGRCAVDTERDAVAKVAGRRAG